MSLRLTMNDYVIIYQRSAGNIHQIKFESMRKNILVVANKLTDK